MKRSLIVGCMIIAACQGDSETEEPGSGARPARFSGSITGTGAPGDVANDLDLPTGDFGATIVGPLLTLFVVPSPGWFLTASIDTDAGVTIPGSIVVGEPPDAPHVTVIAPNAHIYTSVSGAIRFDGCPGATGTVFAGAFVDVRLRDQIDESEIVIDGTFSLTVLDASTATLECAGSGNGNQEPGCGFSENAPCTGPCCPYIECTNQCFIANCFTPCFDPSSGFECVQCVADCEAGCQSSITATCRPLLSSLNTCMETHGCESLADEEGMACATASCCGELEGAFQN